MSDADENEVDENEEEEEGLDWGLEGGLGWGLACCCCTVCLFIIFCGWWLSASTAAVLRAFFLGAAATLILCYYMPKAAPDDWLFKSVLITDYFSYLANVLNLSYYLYTKSDVLQDFATVCLYGVLLWGFFWLLIGCHLLPKDPDGKEKVCYIFVDGLYDAVVMVVICELIIYMGEAELGKILSAVNFVTRLGGLFAKVQKRCSNTENHPLPEWASFNPDAKE